MKQKVRNCLLGILCLLSTLLPFPELTAQEVRTTVSGTVVDKNEKALVGVTVFIKGSKTGTTTNENGEFNLYSKSSKPILVFSYIGYETVEVIPSAFSNIHIVLNEINKQLSEIVVIGYGTLRKKDLTGSVGSVGSKDIGDKPLTSVGEALQGKAPGIQVINAGEPGKNVTLKIRGLGTINNSDPLIVVDGFPTDLGLNSINASDIETVDVLKDASATAIYGARGANGVVMITTKRGDGEGSKLSYSGNYGIQSVAKLPEMLDASGYAALNNDIMINAGMAPNPDWQDPASLGKGTDWMDALFEQTSLQNHTVSFSGGDAKSHHYLSLGMLGQKGVVHKSSYQRYTFQSNNDAMIKDWLKISSNITFSTDSKIKGGHNILNTMKALPTQPVKNEDGSWSGPTGNPYWYGTVRNPIGTTESYKSVTSGYNLLANGSVEVSLFKGLKFKTMGGIDAKFWFVESFDPKYNWKPDPVTISEKYQSSDRSLTYLWDNYFTYDKSFGNSKINIMAGTSAQNNEHKYFNGKKTGFLYDNVNQFENGENITSLTGNTEDWAIFSLIGRANYSYADKYLLTATIRRDGSSRFTGDNKWGTFPSFSAAWRITEEPWFKKPAFLDYMKIRLGYGVTGNQNVGGLYSFASLYKTSSVYSFNNNVVPSLAIVKMPNPTIHWEEVEQTNLGVDINMFKQRVNFTLDAYLKYTNEMLVPMSVPVSTGYSDYDVPDINAGRMVNKGIELSIFSTNIKTDNFEWSSVFNLTYNRGKILELNNDTPMYLNQVSNSYVTIQSVGHQANSFYGFVTDGIFQTEEEVANHAVQIDGGTSVGDIKFKDLNNDGVINAKDRTYIGNPNPDFIFSLSNTFRYKNFDMDIYLYGVAGNEIYNGNRTITESMSSAVNQSSATLNRWTTEHTSNVMPRAVYGDPNNNNRASDRWIEDGSFLRVRNITIGYTIPSRMINKGGIDSFRIYASCENLLTLTHYTGLDPEIAEIDSSIAGLNQSLNGLYGIDYNVYPVVRTISIGCKIIF
ncbi:MAG: TonB-dependent receptor [Rikenellaceae bacterium]|nr:TonB-dependent receptor [Rikenellaceae bacterium]